MSEDASAPNCRCSPTTGGVFTGSDDGSEGTAASARPGPIIDAATTAPPPRPAAASSLRRLSSRSNSLFCEVMAARLSNGSRNSLSQFDDSSGTAKAPPAQRGGGAASNGQSEVSDHLGAVCQKCAPNFNEAK